MSWNITGNQSGPFPTRLNKVHAFTVVDGKATARCGAGYVAPPYRTDDNHRITCRRCRAALKI